MRKLQITDAFAFARIVKKAGIKQQISDAVIKYAGKTAPDDTALAKIGVELFLAIMDGLAEQSAETEVYKFIAAIAEVAEADVKAMSITDFIDTAKAIAAENDLAAFFTSARRLLS